MPMREEGKFKNKDMVIPSRFMKHILLATQVLTSSDLVTDLQLVINFEFLIGTQKLIALKLFQGGVFVFCLHVSL